MKAVVFCALTLLAMQLGAAQLYRWVDEQGRVEWRDTPPPPNAKNVQQRNMSGNTIETSTLPYSLQQAIKNFPVTLWTFDCGDPCTKARAHLARRGIPYSQHDAQKESDALKKLSGSLQAPLLVVGSKQVRGYLEGEWDAALDAAGYPRTPPPGVKISAGKSAPEAVRKPPADASKATESAAPR
ncbi:MAG TPA: glutaredoxin family protein [Burkholderiales bacterium]|nr:glutaredoxin family protein [Burkholderiales bacterium]